MSKPFTQAERELATDLCAACLGQILGIKPETARKKLEADKTGLFWLDMARSALANSWKQLDAKFKSEVSQ